MKKFVSVLSLTVISSTALASGEPKNISFAIDWSDARTLHQGQSLSCDDPETASVTIVAPGTFNQDFKIQDPGGSCKIVSQKSIRDAGGKVSTQVTFQGLDCFSDEEQNFFVDEVKTGKEASLMAEAGC